MGLTDTSLYIAKVVFNVSDNCTLEVLLRAVRVLCPFRCYFKTVILADLKQIRRG